MRSFGVPVILLAAFYLADSTFSNGVYFGALEAVLAHIVRGY